MKGADSLRSIDFYDLWIHLDFKFLSKLKCLDSEKYERKDCRIPISDYMALLWPSTEMMTSFWFRLFHEA